MQLRPACQGVVPVLELSGVSKFATSPPPLFPVTADSKGLKIGDPETAESKGRNESRCSSLITRSRVVASRSVRFRLTPQSLPKSLRLMPADFTPLMRRDYFTNADREVRKGIIGIFRGERIRSCVPAATACGASHSASRLS